MLNRLLDAQDASDKQDADNSSEAPAAWSRHLQERLAALDKHADARSGLARDLAHYVLHGEPVAVVNEVASLHFVAAHLGLVGFNNDDADTWCAFYEEYKHLPAAIALRWARLLETCAVGNGYTYFSLKLPDNSHWAEALLVHSTGKNLSSWSNRRAEARNLSATGIEAMLVEAGLAPSALLTTAFATPVTNGYSARQRLPLVTDLENYADYLQRHLDIVRPLLAAQSVDQRVHMAGLLERASVATLGELAPEVCDFATASSKQVRAAAEPLIAKAGAVLVDQLKKVASEAKPEQRLLALRMLWKQAVDSADQSLRDFVRATAAADKAPTAQALLQELERTEGAGPNSGKSYEYKIPVIDWSSGWSPAIAAALDVLWSDLNRVVDKTNQGAREQHAYGVAKGHNWQLHLMDAFTAEEQQRLRDYLASPQTGLKTLGHCTHWNVSGEALSRFAEAPGVTPVALLKAAEFLLPIRNGRDELDYHIIGAVNAMHRHGGQPGLLELQQMLEAIGYTAGHVINAYCSGWSMLASDWASEAVWPFFAHHEALFIRRIGDTTAYYNFDRKRLYGAMAMMPWPPEAVVDAVFELALGSGKTERLPAQEALVNLPGRDARIVAALASGKAEVRTVAAQWLTRLNHVGALPALEAAVAKEKHDVAKGAMLDALQHFGQPVEKYLDRAALQKDAVKALGKEIPKDIEWFPWAVMPAVHWADNGEAVPNEVLRWLLVQAVKQKSPEPNAVLRKFCGMFDAREREQFGQFVLETWLAEDIRPIPAEDAMRRARREGQQIASSVQSHPQYYENSPHLGRSADEIAAALLPPLLRLPVGSAIGSKGLLAVAAACAGGRAAEPVARYLKEFYGTRAAHGKALIAMLAWIEHPGATQLMLSVGNRFRTKSFQEEATRQAEALAERKGWTMAQLADRTIPSGGFDDTGALELSYGPRTFTARLTPDFKVDLFNPEGKKIAALPEPRGDDDATLAKAAKQALTAAKKEVKSIVTLQTDRLYEALCTERDWPFEDWEVYLNRHAVVRRLIQRLVWVQVEDDKVVRSFRPLDDGTLSDRDDNEVTLDANARIRLAHDSILTPEDVAGWRQHLADYEITPLFQQLGKGVYTLPADQAKANAVEDFKGYLIDSFALRGRALKLGYVRGGTEDGGWFFAYEKRFPTLGLTAAIEFTGNGLPEENRKVALLKLTFVATSDNSQVWQRGGMEVGRVPKILLSECYNDLRLIAADGSGFDPEWEKKSAY